jgi:prolipoprotein diacylglyceryltransferase
MAIHVKTGDTFALPLACALVVGRWGCFCNGCCYGTTTDLPWGRDFGDGLLRHPTQAYESLFHMGMAFLLWLMLREGWLRGHHLQMYLIAYGVYRFLTEFIRQEPIALGGLTFYQGVSLALIAAMIGQWWMERRQEQANNRANATTAITGTSEARGEEANLTPRSHAGAWERTPGRSASRLAEGQDATQSVANARSHAERGNEERS